MKVSFPEWLDSLPRPGHKGQFGKQAWVALRMGLPATTLNWLYHQRGTPRVDLALDVVAFSEKNPGTSDWIPFKSGRRQTKTTVGLEELVR